MPIPSWYKMGMTTGSRASGAFFAGGVPGEPASVPLVGGAGAERPANRLGCGGGAPRIRRTLKLEEIRKQGRGGGQPSRRAERRAKRSFALNALYCYTAVSAETYRPRCLECAGTE
jgi:hypothetical protein